MKTSLKSILLKHLRDTPNWIHGASLEALGVQEGYMGSTVSRRLRELATEGLILREERNGSEWYKAKAPVQIIERRIPVLGIVLQERLF